MKLYRIGPEHFLENYSGLGGSYQDGARWNRPGLPVLYFACSPAVSLLEVANYLPSPRLVPASYRLAEYDWPDSIAIDRLDVAELPDGWDSYPHPTVTQAIGSAWLSKAEKAGLMVPSAASPLAIESVLLVNPLHPDSKQLRLLTKIEKIYSDRTFAGL